MEINMFYNEKMIQPFVNILMDKCTAKFRLFSKPANMLIYEFTYSDYINAVSDDDSLLSAVSYDNHSDNKSLSTIPVKLHFIASPYCEWIIGYNNNNDNSEFYCIAPSDKAFDMTPDIFDNYICIRFEDDIFYFNKNVRNNAVPANMYGDIINYTPDEDSYEYKLCNKLKKISSFSKRAELILAYINNNKKLYSPNDNIRKLFHAVKESEGCITVYTLSDIFGYSPRHISRLFHNTYGYSPKTYCNFIRFQNVLKQIFCDPDKNNSDYLYDVDGYSDQAHFQREFKKFMGMTPRAFIKGFVEKEV